MKKGWTETTLRAVCLKTGQWKPNTEPRSDFYYIDVSAVSNDTFTITSPQAVTGKTAPGRARKIVHARDVIYATVRPTLRRIALVPSEYHDHMASTAFCVARADRKFAVPEFLYFLLLSDQVNNAIAEAQHGASYPAVTDKDIFKQVVSLPPLLEQKKIAAVLLKIQRVIETQEKIIQSLRDLKKSAMQHLFTHGLRGEKTKMTEIGEIPESWKLVTLRTCCQVKSSTIAFRDLETMDTRNEDDVPVHVIKVSDMNLLGNDRDIVRANIEVRLPEAVAKKKAVSPLSIVFPKRGAAIATNKKRLTMEWTLLDPNLIAIVPDDSIVPLYLYYWFLTFDLASLQDLGPTPQLNKKNVDPMKFPVPKTKDEQGEVASMLDTIDAKLTLHESKKSTLQDLFKTTLNKLMAGVIRVGDLDIDAREVN
ncbi:MAG: restriction endonuclease subunit S [Deltaproteobacteria bacterium]|nr:restriction endonuclease subunit S [Deltaproteobacteria bacterium]